MSKQLNVCQHCGAEAREMTEQQSVYVKCTNLGGYTNEETGEKIGPCGMETPRYSASLEYGAKDRVAGIWNQSTSNKPGTKDNPRAVPQKTYYQGMYYLDEGVIYLCFVEYTGSRHPKELLLHNFVVMED